MQQTQGVIAVLIDASLPVSIILISVLLSYGLKAVIDRYHGSTVSAGDGQSGSTAMLMTLNVVKRLIVPGITLLGLSISLQVSSLPADLHAIGSKDYRRADNVDRDSGFGEGVIGHKRPLFEPGQVALSNQRGP